MMEEMLLQYGAMGAMLLWFMYSYKQFERALNNNTQAIQDLKEEIQNGRNARPKQL